MAERHRQSTMPMLMALHTAKSWNEGEDIDFLSKAGKWVTARVIKNDGKSITVKYCNIIHTKGIDYGRLMAQDDANEVGLVDTDDEDEAPQDFDGMNWIIETITIKLR